MHAWKRHHDYIGPCALAAAAGLSGMMLVGAPTGLGFASCTNILTLTDRNVYNHWLHSRLELERTRLHDSYKFDIF